MRRIIHSYWSGTPNAVVDACFERMRAANPWWEVVVHRDFSEAEPCATLRS